MITSVNISSSSTSFSSPREVAAIVPFALNSFDPMTEGVADQLAAPNRLTGDDNAPSNFLYKYIGQPCRHSHALIVLALLLRVVENNDLWCPHMFNYALTRPSLLLSLTMSLIACVSLTQHAYEHMPVGKTGGGPMKLRAIAHYYLITGSLDENKVGLFLSCGMLGLEGPHVEQRKLIMHGRGACDFNSLKALISVHIVKSVRSSIFLGI
ncbi:hypothetical protein VNO77_29522 [Canavalia gladiata]|uniref:Uncharacterized protein n=1 Tax=Canavalia gladiata TaxID=3824 RepID=A0AAN9KWU6_CANGL